MKEHFSRKFQELDNRLADTIERRIFLRRSLICSVLAVRYGRLASKLIGGKYAFDYVSDTLSRPLEILTDLESLDFFHIDGDRSYIQQPKDYALLQDVTQRYPVMNNPEKMLSCGFFSQKIAYEPNITFGFSFSNQSGVYVGTYGNAAAEYHLSKTRDGFSLQMKRSNQMGQDPFVCESVFYVLPSVDEWKKMLTS